MKKKQLKQIENQTQQGRSMVEMLGVLAVIGVISLGGISGYRMAMNRYQANQIANEINLMRTDAKMKAAQGAEELLLGEPYDGESGHLKFNANYGVAVEFEDIETDTPGKTETGYSFALSGIPAGVCKPLATLLDGMDDTAALEINGKDYETAENPCDNEENEVVVAFSSKEIGVSSGIKECDESTCEGYCSSDGACKNCPDDAPWNEATRQCKCNSSSKHWNKEIEACVACSDNSHCTSSSKPACKAGVCDKCTADEECIESGKGEHCSSSGSCITCGSSASAAAWNETTRKCDYCKNVDLEKPNWSGSECVAECPEGTFLNSSYQRCVECLKNEDCEKEDGQHYWCDTDYSANYGTCTPCLEWDKTHGCKIGECESNEDCEEGEYCYLYYGYSCTSEFDKSKGFGAGGGTNKSECRKIEEDINKKGDINSKYIMSTNRMTWWSAERFCKALGNKRMVTISELQCNKDQIKYNNDSSAGECRSGYCHAEGSEMTCNQSSTSDVSSVIKELRKAENGTETKGNYCYWLYDAYTSTTSSSTSCNAYLFYLTNGSVASDGRNDFDNYALCE